MGKESAGILLYRLTNSHPEFLLVHPGGPFWKNKDAGAWSIPKGEITEGEDLLQTAIREFQEETGYKLEGSFKQLRSCRLKSGKVVHAFALQGNIDENNVRSNTFEMEWPPRSGKLIRVPEIDRAQWFSLEEAIKKINPAQQNLLVELNTGL